VDQLWPEQRVVVEADGRETHDTASAFERDRRRDVALQLAGFLVLRFTRRRLREEPGAVLREVAAALALRERGHAA
jgi:very-short-patch-repair endonuclease